MDQRKIMSLGRSSLVISLPKHWTKLNELKQGDVVSLAIQRDRSLAIFPGAGSKKAAKEISLHIEPTEKASTIKRNIISIYLNGYTNIRLYSKDIFPVFQQKAIRNIVQRLYMRIMDCDAKSMHIVSLMDETKASVISGIQRMHILSNSMLQEVLSSLETQDPELAKTSFQLEDDVNHFSYLILRTLTRATLEPEFANNLDVEISDCFDYQILVYRIKQVANSASDIAKHIVMLSQQQLKISDHSIELMQQAGKDAHAIYNQAFKAYFSHSVNKAEELIERGKHVMKSDQEIATWSFLHEKKNPLIICATCSIREDIKTIAEYAIKIAVSTIDRSFSPK
jgi:phosphate uptake regulator